jgi:outer membrane lipoprotein LolB
VPARRAGAVLAAALLAGCASTPLPPALSGRLSLQVDADPPRAAQSLSAGFELSGTAEAGELRLSTPLGTTLAAAAWGPGGARLTTAQGERRFDSLDQLSQEALGEKLPLRALPDWLQGRPWAGAPEPALPLQPGPGFVQLGWTIDLARFSGGQVLASRPGPPGVRLRALLDPSP